MKIWPVSRRGALFSVVTSLFLVPGCASDRLVPIVEAKELLKSPYSVIGRVEAKCAKPRCRDVTIEACTKKLQKKADRRNADAILVDPPILTGTGLHSGLKTIAVECSGSLVRFEESR